MKQFIKNILHKLGVNKAVFYFLLGKGFSFVATPITLYLIASRFTPAEQGYYYTFGSLLGLSIFFELGLGVVITQFASHEYAQLSWTEDNGLRGDTDALSRIISLLRKSIKWYSITMGLFILVILPAGLIFLGSKTESAVIGYVLPWILLILFFGLSTCLIPLTSALEGCGKVSQVQQLRMIQAVVGAVSIWFAILLRGKLLASPIEFIAYWCVLVIWLLCNYKGLILQLFKYKVNVTVQISWFREIFPMQWRIAVSWLCAYFINYLFVPLLFAYKGPIEAGKMGMSLKLSGIVFVLSMAWINTRAPYFGALVKKKEYKELDRMALRCTVQAFFVSVLFSIAMIVGVWILIKYIPRYGDRILPLYIVGVLCFASIVNMLNSAIGGYLRAFKKEPLMVPSIVVAVCVGSSCLITAKYFNANIMSLFYALIVFLVGFGSFMYVFFKKRKEWRVNYEY